MLLPDIEENETREHYAFRLKGWLTAAHLVPGAKGPNDGGCWYCWTKEGLLTFSFEFDTYLHLQCVKNWLWAFPDDEEGKIFAQEFSIAGA
jgi:hypothetical protein